MVLIKVLSTCCPSAIDQSTCNLVEMFMYYINISRVFEQPDTFTC